MSIKTNYNIFKVKYTLLRPIQQYEVILQCLTARSSSPLCTGLWSACELSYWLAFSHWLWWGCVQELGTDWPGLSLSPTIKEEHRTGSVSLAQVKKTLKTNW